MKKGVHQGLPSVLETSVSRAYYFNVLCARSGKSPNVPGTHTRTLAAKMQSKVPCSNVHLLGTLSRKT